MTDIEQTTHLVEQARLLVMRLERLSADSIWARRSSGLRGSLLKWLEGVEANQAQGLPLAISEAELAHLKQLVSAGFVMLAKGAKEIGTNLKE
jgi:hypothetical protein